MNSAVNQLSDATKRRIVSAITGMTDHYKQGSSPNEALEKVAVEFGLLPYQLRIVGRGFNSGQTQTELSRGQTIAEKTAGAYPLADIEGTIKKIYTENPVAKSAQKYVGEEVSPVYAQDPTVLQSKAASTISIPRNAEPVDDAPSRPPVWIAPHLYDAAEKTSTIFQLRDTIIEADRASAESETETRVQEASFKEAVAKYAHDVDVMRDLLFDAERFYGQEGTELFKQALSNFTDSRYSKQVKQVIELGPSTLRKIASSDQHPVLQKLAGCMGSKKKSKKKYLKKVAQRMIVAKLQRMILGKEKVARCYGVEVGSYGQQVESHLNKFATNVKSMLAGIAAHRASSGIDPNTSKFREAELQIEDPEHEQALRQIRLQATLQSLLNYDPIVQSYDPEEVIVAFNELSQAAPATLDNPVMLRANLRRLLQGDIATHEANQLQSADIEPRKLISPLAAQVSQSVKPNKSV